MGRARAVGVTNPEAMTRPELVDEIVRRTEQDLGRRRAARGWFGVARDLLAGMVEQGLHLPDAARLIRGDAAFAARVRQPLATVTLAEIYAAQGHLGRALRTLDEVLALEPDHEVARVLRDRIAIEKAARGLPTEPPPGMEVDFPVIPLASAAKLAETSVFSGEDGVGPRGPGEGKGGSEPVATQVDHATVVSPSDPVATPVDPATVVSPSEPVAATNEHEFEATTARCPGERVAGAPGSVSAEPARTTADVAAPHAEAIAPARATCSPVALQALRGGELCVYWEVDATRCAEAEAAWPDGHLALAVLLASPSPRGARVKLGEYPVATAAGVRRLYVPRLDVVARAVLGWRYGGELIPLVVATELGGASGGPAERARAAIGDER